MSDSPKGKPNQKQEQELPKEAASFLANLTEQDKVLIIVKHELFDGNWDSMLVDLKDRLAGRPYIFKLAGRIQEDIERIGRLKAFERKCGMDLSNYVKVDQL